MTFTGVTTFYPAVIICLDMLDLADRNKRYSAISLYKLYKPINLDITYDRNIKMRFDMKRQIEMLETLKKPLVRENFS